MSTTWQDIQAEMYYDKLEQEFEQRFTEENTQIVVTYISDGDVPIGS